MANPQTENGHTKIANEIMDALCRIRIPGEERQILDSIMRKTYGWNKIEDAISLSQFAEMTGMNKPHIIQSIKGLLLKKVIIVTENGNGPAKVYKFNKNYDEWMPLPKKVKLPKTVISVTENSNLALPKTVPTKDTITKDTITKANISNKATGKSKSEFVFELPDWIPEATWKRFEEMRKEIKKPLTPYASYLITLELQKIKETHNHDPVDVLNQSIVYDYQGVFPLKNGGNDGTGAKQYRTGNAGRTKEVAGKAGFSQPDNQPWPEPRTY